VFVLSIFDDFFRFIKCLLEGIKHENMMEISAGFTYRLKPRTSRSKGPPTNCGTHKVNGRYMIISDKLRQKYMH